MIRGKALLLGLALCLVGGREVEAAPSQTYPKVLRDVHGALGSVQFSTTSPAVLNPGETLDPRMFFPATRVPMGWMMTVMWHIDNTGNSKPARVAPQTRNPTDRGVYEINTISTVDHYIPAQSAEYLTQSLTFNLSQDLPDPRNADGSVPADSFAVGLKNTGEVPVVVMGQYSYIGVPLGINPRIPDPVWGGWQ